jgi:hypothetical protein
MRRVSFDCTKVARQVSREWALLKNGRIVNVVTTTMCKRRMQERYPDYEVAWLYSLPDEVKQQYQHWNERP